MFGCNFVVDLHLTNNLLMRFFTTLALAGLLMASAAQAQQITIGAARQAATGASVTVGGRVQNGGELGPIRYIYDGTGAIGVYFAAAQLTANPVLRGDSLIVTGVISPYNNLMEMNPISAYNVVSHDNPLDTAVFNSSNWTSAYAEEYEGRLVRLNRIPSIQTSTGVSVSNFPATAANFQLNHTASLVVRTVASSTGPDGIVGKPAPTDTFDIVGVMSQFSAAVPNAGYQLLPRLYEDFVRGQAPNINSSILQTDVTTASLTLTFTTQNQGNTQFEYGPTPALGTLVDDATMGNIHTMTLSNLLPAHIYYVKATSINGAGTSTSNIAVFVTQSQSSGKMKTYFTRAVDTTVALPGNKAVNPVQAVDDTLIAYINRAQESLDIAIYNWNNSGLSDITAAVNAANARGVKVRIVYNGTSATSNIGLNTLSPSIRTIGSPSGHLPGSATAFYGIMHNKFVVIDAESQNPNLPIVWTGSTNWTGAMMTTDWNNVITVQDQSLARVFKLEFEEMWGSDSMIPGAVFNGTTGTARFGPTKTDNTPHFVKLTTGQTINPYFSPTDGNQTHLIETIASANSSFHFSIFALTRTEIGYAFADKYRALGAGNCSRGLLDAANSDTAVLHIMANQMHGNVLDYAPAGIYHHKYCIVDQDNATSDPTVMTGSYNWSAAANGTNDENAIIVHDQLVANQYYQEFTQRWKDNGQTSCILVANKPALSAAIKLAPNPAFSQVQVSLPGLAGHTVRILAADGRVMQTAKAIGEEMTLSVGHLPAGAYLVQVEGVAVPVRFVKQ